MQQQGIKECALPAFPLKAYKTLRAKKSAHSRVLDVHQSIISRPFAMDDSERTGFDDSEAVGA